MDKELVDRVKRFVADQAGDSPEGISLCATLLGDLGIDGADGWELIEAFGEEFGVDLGGFEPSRYFGPEGGIFPPLFLVQFFRVFILNENPHKIAGVEPITVQDLVIAAETKH